MALIQTRELSNPPAGCTFQTGDWHVLAKHRYPVARACDLGDKPMAVVPRLPRSLS